MAATRRRRVRMALVVAPVLALLWPAVAGAAPFGPLTPLTAPDPLGAWAQCGGAWAVRDGVLVQSDGRVAELDHAQAGHAYLRQPACSDFTLSVEFRVAARSPGVGGAEVLFRATDSQTYYVVQFSTEANCVLLAKASPSNFWTDIRRTAEVAMPRDTWHTVVVGMTGSDIEIKVNGKVVLQARDETLKAGLLGLGSSQALVDFRNLSITGQAVDLQPPWRDLGGRFAQPDFKTVCADAGAGGYEAFPDVCRCANGDLLCVFYAGYGHVSLPNQALPRGARVAAVRSRDEGQSWSPAQVVADTPWDDRDPSIVCLKDGTLLCNWFTYYADFQAPQPGKPTHFKELWLAASQDHGVTWSEPRQVPVTENLYWGCSSPIIELADGALLWPIYREYQGPLRAWSAMLRSTDHGQTWKGPYWVDENNPDNDEPAVLELPDGRVLCLMRNNQGNSMWWSESLDHGLTWKASQPTGFPGHAAYLFRSADGVLLMGHRVPGTSVHWSLDDGRTWAGSLLLDTCIGAYPSLVALKDGSVLCVYYEEGDGSSIRAQKLSVSRAGVRHLPWTPPN
jgi:sialidase-1